MNIRFSGFGGQGVILAGVIYGHAAVLDGKNVVQTQSYGSASRGGACKCDVIISENSIYELESIHSDILITLSQQAYDKYSPYLKPEGILFVEKDLVHTSHKNGHQYTIPATDIAQKKFNKKIMANMVVLGFMTSILDIASKEAVKQAIRENVPAGTEDTNIAAFETGYKYRDSVTP